MKYWIGRGPIAVPAFVFFILAAASSPASSQQKFWPASGWASPAGVIQISTDGPIADLGARIGGEDIYVTPRLPAGSVFVAEFKDVSPESLDSVYYKTSELLRFAPAQGSGNGTLRIKLPAEALAESYLPITLYSADGKNRYSPYIPYNAYDYDDFSLRAVRIETPDGRVLKPASMVGYYGNDLTAFKPYDEEKSYEFGNGEPNSWDDSKILMAVFAFEMDIEFARDFELDVSGLSLKEGNATVELVRDGKKVATIPIRIDATAPVIDIRAPRDLSPLRGKVTLDASAADSGSGIGSISASLDGAPATLPLVFQAAMLAEGRHEFAVRALDAAGNESRASYSFRIADENPAVPAISSPAKGSDGKTSILVSDPQKDELSVELRRGWLLTAAEGSVIAVADIYPRDPPLSLEGPAEIFLEPEALSKADGEAVETSSLTGFPGHRFEIDIPQVAFDSARITWQGSTLPGRHVSAWTWDFTDRRWVFSASGGSGSFVWDLDPVRQVQAGKAQVLVLDPPDRIDSPFTVAWMSDPQYYAESFPNIYGNLANWLAGKYRSGEIGYVVDTGDLVNKSLERRQWVVADTSMKILDEAGMPYGAISGNHDIQHEQKVYDAYLYYFGDKRFAGEEHRGGSWKGGINHYDLLSFGAYDFIFLFIGNGYETDPEGLAWADGILKTYPDRIAVVSTHYYLNANGTKSAGGKAIYDALVEPNDNVRLVLCGHIHGVATVKQRIGRADGSSRLVTEMLADYQSNPFGGEGYLRLLSFDPSKSILSVRTYSPWLDKWNSFGQAKDEFDLEFEFPEPVKQLSTDYFAAEIFGKATLAGFGPLPSGSVLRVDAPDGAWYTLVRDGFGGVSKSAVIEPEQAKP
jgi:hypothetical protein